MADTNATTNSGPAVGSEEWVKATLDKAQATAEVPDIESQATGAEGSAPPEAAAGQAATTVPRWNEVVIPTDDDTVDGFFRGKTVDELNKSFKASQREMQQAQREVNELRSKLAAQQAVADLVKELKPAAPTPTPIDPYAANGLNLETDPILNPTKFFPQQQQIVLGEAEKIAQKKIEEFESKLAEKEQFKREQEAITWALETVKRERGLTDDDMRNRVGFLLFETSNRHRTADGQPDKNALFDPAKIMAVNDSVWGGRQPAAAAPPASVSVPNPPGSKATAAVETVQAPTTSLKGYEREALAGAADSLRRSLGIKVDDERLAARYAKRMKEIRG